MFVTHWCSQSPSPPEHPRIQATRPWLRCGFRRYTNSSSISNADLAGQRPTQSVNFATPTTVPEPLSISPTCACRIVISPIIRRDFLSCSDSVMRDLVVLFIHFIATLARLLGPGGARSLVAESLLLKHQLLILNRSRQRAPNLSASDRIVAGWWRSGCVPRACSVQPSC